MSQNVMVGSLSSASAKNFTMDMPDWNSVDTRITRQHQGLTSGHNPPAG